MNKSLKAKFFYISILVIFCAGFFYLGWYEHKTVPTNIIPNTPPVSTSTDSTTDLGVIELYDSFSDKQCPFIDTPDTQDCLTNLADSTLVKAKILENQLFQPSSKKKMDQILPISTYYYNDLHTVILSLQKTKDSYINNYCDLAGMLSYGGTGQESDVQSCRYYYAQQYLNTLEALMP